MTKKTLSIVALTLMISLAAEARAFGAKPPKPPAIEYELLDVTIDCPGGNICSDNAGEYVNGVDGVSGGLDVNGNINFNFSVNSPSTGVSSRQVSFAFGDPIGVASPPMPGTGTYYATLRSAPAPEDMFPVGWCGDGNAIASGPVQNIPLGRCQFVQLVFALYTGSIYPRWRLQFHSGESASDENTSYAVVTCTATAGGKCSEWLVEPSFINSQNAAMLVEVAYANARGGQTTVTRKGYFNMPFRLTLFAAQP